MYQCPKGHQFDEPGFKPTPRHKGEGDQCCQECGSESFYRIEARCEWCGAGFEHHTTNKCPKCHTHNVERV